MSIKTASLGAVSLLAAAAFAAPAFADGMPGHGRISSGSSETRPCSTSANVGLTTDYVFRGISQSNENAAVQCGVDLTCGRFYGGVWGSSIWDPDGVAEVDIYGGYKFGAGPVTLDVGFIYYTYPGASLFSNTLELKVGASGEVWKGGTLGGTVYYAPDPDVTTLEGTFTQLLPKVGMFSPTVSAAYGNVRANDHDDSYNYWNVGLTLGFMEKWSVDVRYWDTDLDGCTSGVFSCDSRVVGTVKYTF
jgi:uncharacterized protein (TIGR02001 family)